MYFAPPPTNDILESVSAGFVGYVFAYSYTQKIIVSVVFLNQYDIVVSAFKAFNSAFRQKLLFRRWASHFRVCLAAKVTQSIEAVTLVVVPTELPSDLGSQCDRSLFCLPLPPHRRGREGGSRESKYSPVRSPSCTSHRTLAITVTYRSR